MQTQEQAPKPEKPKRRKETELEQVILKSRGLRPRTRELYLRCVRAYLAFAGTSPKNWTTKSVQAWRDDMRARQMKAQSINVALNALRYAARHRSRRAFWHGNPTKFADRVDTLPVNRVRDRARDTPALTYDQGRRLIAACRGERPRDLRDAALAVLSLRTGMLRFSICQIRLEDVGDETLTFTKRGGERHTIRLDLATKQALTRWTRWLRSQGITQGSLFRSLGRGSGKRVPIGKALTPDGLYRALRQRAAQANIDDLNLYTFRKTFLDWAQKAGAKPHQIAAVTGGKANGAEATDSDSDTPANFLLPDWIA